MNKRAPQGDKLKIYGRVRVDRIKAEFYTNFAINPSDWDTARQFPKTNITIKEELLDIESKVYKIRRNLIDQDIYPTAKLIVDLLKNKQNKFKPISFIGFYEDYIQDMIDKNERAESTIRHQKGTLAILKKYTTYSKKKDIKMTDIDYKFLKDIDYYMSAVYISPYDKKIMRNTINKHHSRIRTIINAAVLEGYINRTPYEKFKMKFTKTKRVYLNFEELERIEKLDLSDNVSLQKIRDIFLFSCNTGVRFKDAQLLTMKNIRKMEDGQKYLELKMTKTSDFVTIPLTNQVLDIVKKYKDHNSRLVENKILPRISNQKFNEYVKVIAKLAKIEKRITHHVSRHTFATVALNRGISKEVVQMLLGHASIQTTEIYAKIMEKTIFEQMKKME